jgi:hypothetical protein
MDTLAKNVLLYSKRREMWECGNKFQSKMLEGNFNSMNEIISATDEIYFDHIHNFVVEDDMERLGAGAEYELERRANNPVDNIGFSSGMPKWDDMIGYLRRDMLAFISARAKVGKSMLGLNVARHVAQFEELPVLYMDSEMSREEVRDRLVAHVAQVDISLIENGRWKSEENAFRTQQAFKVVESLNIEYLSIRGMNIESIMSGCRRFLFKKVKRNHEGIFNQCLIVYDYLKLDYGGNIGDTWHLNLAKSVVNFKDMLGATKTTGLVLGQQNRSGIAKFDPKTHKTITQDTEDTVAGTDEILKSSSNVSSLRFKTTEEKMRDGEEHGNVSLTPFVARHGRGGQWVQLSEGIWDRDSVNLVRTPEKMTIKEISTRGDLERAKSIAPHIK